jgi:hypothetical protein
MGHHHDTLLSNWRGSRSRLAPERKGIRPYLEFSGIDRPDEDQSDSIGGLYSRIGGGSKITLRDNAYVAATPDVEED